MSNPSIFSGSVAREVAEAETTLRELLARAAENMASPEVEELSDLLAQSAIDAPLAARYGSDIKLAAVVAILDDLASRVRELEASD